MRTLRQQASLRLQVAADYEGLSRQAAEIIVKALREQPDLLLCASAGGTPTRTYEILGAYARKQPALVKRMRVLQIDEWAGLPPGSDASCETDLRRKLLDPLHLAPERYAGFRSHASDPKADCRRVAAWLRRHGPIDVCILGLGLNGHVAMNEPGEAAVPHVHVARLAKSSQQHALLKPLKRKPTHGLTLGLGDILQSRKILLLVNGPHKLAAVRRLLRPRATPRFPASFLWLHPDAWVLCDRSAVPPGL
jgi:galactosamine-6-phosphate isomerase